MKKLLIALTFSLLCYCAGAMAAVNINTATADQLSALNGIGAVKAQAIVDDRKANGPYKSVDDLSRVSGVGSKTVDSIRSEATVEDSVKAPKNKS